MKDMPLKKVRNFGGKLGAELQALGCTTAGEVLALPPATLHQHFGERATWILYTVQGNSDEQVQVSGWLRAHFGHHMMTSSPRRYVYVCIGCWVTS